FSLGFHSAVIQPSCSSLCRAGYSDPSLTCRTSPETCFSRCPIAQPWSGSNARIFRISWSSVPWTRSVGLLICPPLVTEMSVPLPLPVRKRNVKGPRLPAFPQWMGGKFTLKPLNLMRPLAPRLPFLFNLILTLLDQQASVGGR